MVRLFECVLPGAQDSTGVVLQFLFLSRWFGLAWWFRYLGSPLLSKGSITSGVPLPRFLNPQKAPKKTVKLMGGTWMSQE